MRNKILKKIFSWSFLLLLGYLVFLLFVFLSIIYIHDDSEVVSQKENPDTSIYEYNTLDYDSKTNTYSKGIQTSFKKLKKEEFTFTDFKDGRYSLLSNNFANDRYHCTGKCVCDDQEQRRRSTSIANVISHKLIYLVATVSSIMAVKKASDYFRKECENEMKDICSSATNIKSEVDECKQYDEHKDTTIEEIREKSEEEEDDGEYEVEYVGEEEEEEDEENVLKKPQFNELHYFCFGFCNMDKDIMKRYETYVYNWSVEKDKDKEMDFDEAKAAINYDEKVPEYIKRIDWDRCNAYTFEGEMFVPKSAPDPDALARQMFIKAYLEKYCFAFSEFDEFEEKEKHLFFRGFFPAFNKEHFCVPDYDEIPCYPVDEEGCTTEFKFKIYEDYGKYD